MIASALTKFFTTPPEHEIDERFVIRCEQFTPSKIGIQLKLDGTAMTPNSLRNLE